MKPTEEEFEQVANESYYESDYCDEQGIEWDWDEERAWKETLAYEGVEWAVKRSGGDNIEFVVIKHKESGKHYRAGYYYSSWDSTDYSETCSDIREVEERKVTRVEWTDVET